jgi:hypothetical protein
MALAQTGMMSGGTGHMGAGSTGLGHMGQDGNGHMGQGQNGAHHGKLSVKVRGTVVDVNLATSELTVDVTRACRVERDLIGQQVTFKVDPKAIVRLMGFGRGTLDDILPEDVVKVMGRVENNEYVAYRIMVY